MKPADAHPVPGVQPAAMQSEHHSDAPGAPWDDPQEQQPRPPLTHEEAVALFGEPALRPARMTPFRVVALQLGVTVLAMLVWFAVRYVVSSSEVASAGEVAGEAAYVAALSALIGGACVVVPNAVFAVRLAVSRQRPSVGGLIIGELLKIAITLTMLITASIWYPTMDWAAMLVTFFLALKMLWIALVLR